MERVIGTVKFFNRIKGFGYILGESGRSFFVSHRDINSDAPFKYLMEGDQVSFEVAAQPDKREDKAVNVVEINRESEVTHGHKAL